MSEVVRGSLHEGSAETSPSMRREHEEIVDESKAGDVVHRDRIEHLADKEANERVAARVALEGDEDGAVSIRDALRKP